VIPIGKARIVQEATKENISNGTSCGVITYGRGVYWAVEASLEFAGKVEILDLRSINPLDHNAMNTLCQSHGKIMIVTEESIECSFALGLAGRLQRDNFNYLDAPIQILGSVDTPAIPLNSSLESELLPNSLKVKSVIELLLNY
jgi:2-oxoisovalerate dehydrogenase E1 component